ncbi:hypothetical protein MMC28_005617 [Mycoblastus sanguinarius]|nr:hypothetical protein [Mycoblastus sanguinarius]
MSPLLQGKNRLRKQDNPSIPSSSSTSIRSQNWFHQPVNRSVPDLTLPQRANRAAGFSSIKELARSSRCPVPSVPPSTCQPLSISHENVPSRRDDLGRRPVSGGLALPVSPKRGLHPSNDNGGDSFSPDKSGDSKDSHLTTPSSARPYPLSTLETNVTLPPKTMGNQTSRVIEKARKIKKRRSVTSIRARREESPQSLPDQLDDQIPALDEIPRRDDIDPHESSLRLNIPRHGSSRELSSGINIPSTGSSRESSSGLNVPRRRSSLTTLQLNSSQLDLIDPQRNLQHRASNLTEPRRRPSTLTTTTDNDTIRPDVSISPSTITPATENQKNENLLAPLKPRPQSTFSNAPSANARNSQIPWHIRLPKTFPDGPITVPAPSLTITHYKCYQSHRRILISSNKFHPVPCMACGGEEGERRWKCTWCALRICDGCKAEFDARERDLTALIQWLEGSKTEVQAAEKDDKENLREASEIDGLTSSPSGVSKAESPSELKEEENQGVVGDDKDGKTPSP